MALAHNRQEALGIVLPGDGIEEVCRKSNAAHTPSRLRLHQTGRKIAFQLVRRDHQGLHLPTSVHGLTNMMDALDQEQICFVPGFLLA